MQGTSSNIEISWKSQLEFRVAQKAEGMQLTPGPDGQHRRRAGQALQGGSGLWTKGQEVYGLATLLVLTLEVFEVREMFEVH